MEKNNNLCITLGKTKQKNENVISTPIKKYYVEKKDTQKEKNPQKTKN